MLPHEWHPGHGGALDDGTIEGIVERTKGDREIVNLMDTSADHVQDNLDNLERLKAGGASGQHSLLLRSPKASPAVPPERLFSVYIIPRAALQNETSNDLPNHGPLGSVARQTLIDDDEATRKWVRLFLLALVAFLAGVSLHLAARS